MKKQKNHFFGKIFILDVFLLESEGAISSVCLDARSGIGHVPVGG
jgi:hypothetical protein